MSDRRAVAEAYLAESLRLLVFAPYSHDAMHSRELMAGLAYQLGWFPNPPDEDIEGELMSRNLVIRMAPAEEVDDDEGA